MTASDDQPLTPYAAAPLLVGDVVKAGLTTCDRQTTAAAVAELMQGTDSPVVVIREFGPDRPAGRVWGVVSNDDIVRVFAAGNPRVSAGALARTPVVRIHADQTVREAARVMDAARTPGLLVIDESGHATGWLSSADLVRALASGKPAVLDGRSDR
jgi:CBS domain-containing protein